MGLIIMFSAIAIIISIANTNSGNTVDTYVNVEPTVAVLIMINQNFLKI